MKKKMIAALLAFFALTALGTGARAVDVEAEQAEGLGVDGIVEALPPEVRDILGDYAVREGTSYDSALERIGQTIKSNLTSLVSEGLRSAVLLLATVLLCALAGSVYDSELPDFIPLCGTVAISAVAVGDVRSFIGLGTETLYRLSDYSKVLLPSLASAAAASGAITSATAKHVATALFTDIMLSAAVNIIMPLVYAYIAVIIANAALGGETLDAVAKLLKWVCTTLLTALTLAFTIYLSLTGVISGSADATVTKLAKSAISTSLPVVGGIVAGAAETIVAGAGMLRNTIGAFGLISVIALCLAPFLTLGTRYLLYKVTAGVAGALFDKRLGGLISGMGSAFGIVLGLVGCGAFMLFISLVSSMKAVTGS